MIKVDLKSLDQYPEENGCYIGVAGMMGLIYFHQCKDGPSWTQLYPSGKIAGDKLNKEFKPSLFSSIRPSEPKWLPIKINLEKPVICNICENK